MIERSYYSDTIEGFLQKDENQVLGAIASANPGTLESTQRDAWLEQIRILNSVLSSYAGRGKLYFEYSIPRLGKRVDVVAVVDHVVFVIEFKVGESEFTKSATDQVWDYGLDLKNFHETSHAVPIAPVLVPTAADDPEAPITPTRARDNLLRPINSSVGRLALVIERVLSAVEGGTLDVRDWETGRYYPTPTIVEAATALYGGHSVADISRSDASAINLSKTSDAISAIIQDSRLDSKRSICFVTGVPGAGKTLVGLNIATSHTDKNNDLYSVYLSGNGPLVNILREALARDKVQREAEQGRKFAKGTARSEVKMFIQNVHNFRDECLQDADRPPIEHVVLFDEAQRAWNQEQTENFMRRKRGRPDFDVSEPEFLISCLDRHLDWAVIVCLVGGGQEINKGEAGIGEWIDAVLRSFPEWHIHISSKLHDSEYGAGRVLDLLSDRARVAVNDDLHLGVSLRSFRAEHVSTLVKQLLDLEEQDARETFGQIEDRYPIVLTRDVRRAKEWLRDNARGSERYGIVVSSQAERLKPHAIDVKSPMDPVHWFLDGKEDTRSSYYLESVATEFDVQGLELDWACVTWDADFRFSEEGWQHFSFSGSKWRNIKKDERQAYLKNAYRVLLTRARQGMVIVVPEGDDTDHTRPARYYDPTFEYLRRIGFRVL